MYTTFTTKGFRGLGQLSIRELTAVTVVTGRNGVGKSALLEALFLHACGPTAPASALAVVRPMRGLPPVHGQTDGRVEYPWDPFFDVRGAQQDIDLMARVDGETRGVVLHAHRDVGAAFRIEAQGDTPQGGELTAARLDVTTTIEGHSSQTWRQRVLLEPGGQLIRLESTPDVLGPSTPARIVKGVGAINFAEAFSDARRQDRDHELLRVLSAIDPRIRGVELLLGDGGLTLHARMDSGPLMPFSSLGEGVSQVATLVLSVIAAPGGLVLIDELERGLHHSVFADVWSALSTSARRSRVQLVVSTHNDECIAGAARAMADNPASLSLVRLRSSTEDAVPRVDPHASPVEAVIYPGARVMDAVEFAVEVR